MPGQRVGYIRVSSEEQHPDRQLDGIELDHSFTDRCSGSSVERPKLTELMSYVRDGDSVVVHSMDRLARNLVDLRRLVETLTSRGVCVQFVKEHLTFTGDDSSMATLLLSVMGAVAEFERATIGERQREGIAIAKKRGVYQGRPPSLTPKQIEEVRRRRRSETIVGLAKEYGVSRQSIYRYLRAGDESARP